MAEETHDAGAQDDSTGRAAPALALSQLATDLRPFTEPLHLPRSAVLLLLGELDRQKRLRLEPEPAWRVYGPELVAAIEAAGLRVIRS